LSTISKKTKEGTYQYRYDPAIVQEFSKGPEEDINLEPLWTLIKCPTYILHGEKSDLLSLDTVNRMLEIKPDTQVASIPNCGHAPSLMPLQQISIVKDWLRNDSNIKEKSLALKK